jgi:hypothetical protein
MIKLKDILTERISTVVYHFTTTEAAGYIIDGNKFRLEPIPIGSTNTIKMSDKHKVDPGKKYEEGYYMSVARTKVEGYTKGINSARCFFVRFELDGNKLSNRYKGGPFDYFPQHQGDNEYEEYEDRIYSKDRFIPNAKSYIKRMDVDVSRKCSGGFNIKTLIEIATSSGVPTFIFPSREKWGQQSSGIQIRNVKDYEQLKIDYNTGLFVSSMVKQ